jgi:hypothetical protein
MLQLLLWLISRVNTVSACLMVVACKLSLQATQVSPWIVTLDALEPFKCEAAAQDPPVLRYLQESSRHTWNVGLSASITPAGAEVETTVTRTNLKHL